MRFGGMAEYWVGHKKAGTCPAFLWVTDWRPDGDGLVQGCCQTLDKDVEWAVDLGGRDGLLLYCGAADALGGSV